MSIINMIIFALLVLIMAAVIFKLHRAIERRRKDRRRKNKPISFPDRRKGPVDRRNTKLQQNQVFNRDFSPTFSPNSGEDKLQRIEDKNTYEN